ncbi:MAG: DNA-binding domain-containing protein [Hyphomicrobiales bacterium]|nr:DNA-binding domain-containing protein [Hyphomicrobiales bacterium]
MDVLQKHFAEALRNGDGNALGKMVGDDSKFSQRFSVYRNNVYHSLTVALSDAYPAVKRLVGDDFFFAMARVYLDGGGFPVHAPLHDFGKGFPEFIADFAPAEKSLPWLGDVGRIERAWLQAYHGADAEGDVMNLEALSSGDAERISGLRLVFHPSLCIERLSWGVFEVWEAQGGEGVAGMKVETQENFIVAVRGMDGNVRVGPFGGNIFDFFERLHDGKSVMAAARDVDVSVVGEVLGGLVRLGAVIGVKE